MNDVQLKTAKKIGIRPIQSRDDAEMLSGKLDEITLATGMMWIR